MLFIHILIFLASIILLLSTGTFFVESLIRMAKFLKWREFVIALIVPALAGTVPNLFFGFSSIIHKVPQLSFSDAVGGNVVDLTLTVALATLLAGGGLPARSKLVQSSSIFTILIAILPLLLVFDRTLSRGDGIVLIAFYFIYIFWIFSKRGRFTQSYEKEENYEKRNLKLFLRDILRVFLGVIVLAVAAEGMVRSALYFAISLNLPLIMIGILVVGLGNSFPEIYFSALCARKGKTWMILGDVMGAIIAPATLVLGIVAFISPFQINDLSPFAIARIFLIISALFFLLCVRTGQKITRKEAIFLLLIYVVFVVCEIIF